MTFLSPEACEGRRREVAPVECDPSTHRYCWVRDGKTAYHYHLKRCFGCKGLPGHLPKRLPGATSFESDARVD